MASDNVGSFPVAALSAAPPPPASIGKAPKTEVQHFAEEVGASHLGIDRSALDTLFDRQQHASLVVAGISITDVVNLVEVIGQIILRIIESCPAHSDQKIVATIAKPRFWQRVRVRNIVKDNFDCSGNPRWRRDSGAVAEVLLDCGARAAGARVQHLLDEVRSDNKWLV